MLILVTHAQRSGEPNPSHTTKGLIDLTSLLGVMTVVRRYFGTKIVYVGFGRRLGETYRILAPALSELRVMHSHIFGTEGSRSDFKGRNIYLSGDGEEVLEDEYLGLADIPDFDCWETIMSKLPNGSIIITGREFMRCFGVKSKSCSIYEADVKNKKIIPIIKQGVPTKELSVIFENYSLSMQKSEQ